MKKIMIILFAVLLSVVTVVAFSTVEITAPAAYSTQASVFVNISGGVNASGFPFLKVGDVVNITILNKSSSSGAYGVLNNTAQTLNASNASTGSVAQFWNHTVRLTDGDRHWIRLNFTNVSRADDGSYGGALTSEKIIDIDADRAIFSFGGWNMSFVTADGSTSYCGVSNTNVWACSSG